MQVCLIAGCLEHFRPGARLDDVRYGWCRLSLVPLHLSMFCTFHYRLFFQNLSSCGHLEDSTPMIWRRGDNYILANAVNYLTIVLVAPVIEEFFIRGILLTRWTVKWDVTRAILASSIVFGLLHTNAIGGFCFACVMAIFYIRTKSLFVPIFLHILNNLTAWIAVYFTMDLDTPASYQTIAEFQESWWIGLIALVISIPCVILFCRYYLPMTDWRVPYLTELSSNSESEDFVD